jgi:predicted RNA-binding Zn-ribbon protein involved in translation (DUF1610 family)
VRPSDIQRHPPVESPAARRKAVSKLHCPQCGTAQKANARFCRKCGASLAYEPAVRTCPHCGEEIKSRSRFCSHCGKSI